ncbi:DUF4352 domain-containing protein [Alkalibacillus almallahensis]|uniref:DUF4352 domain-containing protein n=1 Tax=Alkalibacillus almallahensis TaxID=1379154 RepID=UPI0014219026|nr:DUF4352 domain-containing protein [Alkalibacillus almallahensis]NIK11153.1 ABC-type glycerol-3-phosphate transport system substrate-binding protein [Alkalibacillus almallahensis]
MKRFLIMLGIIAMVAFLSACGEESDADSESNGEGSEEQQEEETQSDEESEDGSSDDSSNDESSDEEGNSDSEEASEGTTETEVGATVENEGGTFTLHSRNQEAQTFETGPVKLTIEKVVAASGELNEELATMMETDEIDYIQVDLSVENTSEEDITFYSSQGKMATSTGEQLDPDMFMSDHIEGEMMANTKASGTFFYVLENSNAEDVESARLVFSAPTDQDFEAIGEELDFEIELKKE